MNFEKIKVILIGACNRGTTYTDGMKNRSDKFEVVAVAEPIESRRNDIKKKHKIADKDNGLIKTNLSLMYYKYEALLSNPDRYLPFVLDEIAEIWGDMLYNNATTFWETTRGEDDFFKTASLCHGWSAIPVYVFGKFLNDNYET